MVGMDDEHRRQSRTGQNLDETLGDARREHDGQTGMDPQPAQGGNGVQRIHEPPEPVVIEQQGIAAREDHLRDGCVTGDGLNRRSHASLRSAILGIGKRAAEAVPAIDGTGSRGEQQGTAGIFLHQARRS